MPVKNALNATNRQTTIEKAYKLFDFIRSYMRDHQRQIPTRRQMASGVGIPEKNTSQINYLLDILEQIGAIKMTKGKSRSIEITNVKTARLRVCPVEYCQYWTPYFDDSSQCPDHKIKLEYREFIEL